MSVTFETRRCEWCGDIIVGGNEFCGCPAEGEINRLRGMAELVIHETSADDDGNMPHEPREALLILRDAAKVILTPNFEVSGLPRTGGNDDNER